MSVINEIKIFKYLEKQGLLNDETLSFFDWRGEHKEVSEIFLWDLLKQENVEILKELAPVINKKMNGTLYNMDHLVKKSFEKEFKVLEQTGIKIDFSQRTLALPYMDNNLNFVKSYKKENNFYLWNIDIILRRWDLAKKNPFLDPDFKIVKDRDEKGLAGHVYQAIKNQAYIDRNPLLYVLESSEMLDYISSIKETYFEWNGMFKLNDKFSELILKNMLKKDEDYFHKVVNANPDVLKMTKVNPEYFENYDIAPPQPYNDFSKVFIHNHSVMKHLSKDNENGQSILSRYIQKNYELNNSSLMDLMMEVKNMVMKNSSNSAISVVKELKKVFPYFDDAKLYGDYTAGAHLFDKNFDLLLEAEYLKINSTQKKSKLKTL